MDVKAVAVVSHSGTFFRASRKRSKVVDCGSFIPPPPKQQPWNRTIFLLTTSTTHHRHLRAAVPTATFFFLSTCVYIHSTLTYDSSTQSPRSSPCRTAHLNAPTVLVPVGKRHWCVFTFFLSVCRLQPLPPLIAYSGHCHHHFGILQ